MSEEPDDELDSDDDELDLDRGVQTVVTIEISGLSLYTTSGSARPSARSASGCCSTSASTSANPTRP